MSYEDRYPSQTIYIVRWPGEHGPEYRVALLQRDDITRLRPDGLKLNPDVVRRRFTERPHPDERSALARARQILRPLDGAVGIKIIESMAPFAAACFVAVISGTPSPT